MRSIIAPILGLIAGLLIAGPAQAQAMCGDRSTVVASLEKMYSEAPVSMGLASNGAVIEILASPTGTFTIILTRPSGITCVMAAGKSWENVPEKPKGPKI